MFLRFFVCAVARVPPVSLVCVGDSDTSVSPDVFSRDSLSKSVQCRLSQLETARQRKGIPCHERHSVPL